MHTATIQRFVTRLISAVGLLIPIAADVRADMVNIPTIGTINMLPNTTSAYTTVTVNDLNPGTPIGMVAWNLGFRVVPLGGATGTVTINTTMPYPTSNNIFASPFPALAPTVSSNSPAAGDVSVSSSDGSFAGPTVPGGGANLVQIRFTASPDATGNFALRLVDSGTYQNTFWNDNAPYVDDDNPGNYPHDFLVGGASFFSGIQLGTIALPAAVPEPSSLLLTGGAAVAAAWRTRRRRTVAAVSKA